MKRTIRRSYKNGSQVKGYEVGVNVYQRMNGNTQFANEQLLVNALKVNKELYEGAKADASTGDSIKVGIKNDRFKDFMAQLDLVADAVEAKANGDFKIAQEAGFDTLSDTRRSIDFLEMPTGLTAEDVKGRKGFIKVSRKNDPDSISTAIEYQVQGEADAPWQNGTYSTASTALVGGLPSGKYVAVRIYSTGRKGLKSDTTDAVVVLVS
jgi:hypothetical protein